MFDRVLDLSSNVALRGDVGVPLALSKLSLLKLYNTRVSGSIPSSIGALTSLT